MGCVDNNLEDGEYIIYRAQVHKAGLATPVIFALIAVAFTFILINDTTPHIRAVIVALLGYVGTIAYTVKALSLVRISELAVTNSRIVGRQGLFSKQTVAFPVAMVEAIEVGGGFIDDIINRGSIRIIGEGAPEKAFYGFSRPNAFKRKVMEVVDISQTSRQ